MRLVKKFQESMFLWVPQVLKSPFSVLYFSVHRYDNGNYWPRLAESNYDHVGEGVGVGYNVNVPLNEVGFRATRGFRPGEG